MNDVFHCEESRKRKGNTLQEQETEGRHQGPWVKPSVPDRLRTAAVSSWWCLLKRGAREDSSRQ